MSAFCFEHDTGGCMRAFSLDDMRSLLSGAAASRLFEEWARLAEERTAAEERMVDLRAQALLSEARVRLAEETARAAAACAEEQRARALDPALDPEARPFARLEAEALATTQLGRAHAALAEAQERRRRAAMLTEEAAELGHAVEGLRERQRELRGLAKGLGGHVGESCLFFAEEGGRGDLLVLPLCPIPAGEVVLEAFVLHRLGAGLGLGAAVALRDAPLVDLPPLPEELLGDALEPRSEHDLAGSRR